MEHYLSGAPAPGRRRFGATARRKTTSSSTRPTEIVGTIKELLETRVRPAVAQDGGDITFQGFSDGVVYLEHEGLVLGLPVLDRDAQARHREPAAPFHAGSAGSPPGLRLSV